MEKSATVGVVGRLGGLYDDAQLRSSSSDEVNGFFNWTPEIQIWAQSQRRRIRRAQSIRRTIRALVNLTEGEKIRLRARMLWPNTFRLDCTELGKPIGPVTRQYSCEAYLGRPMKQRVPGTCAPVACTVCLDIVHRFEYEKLDGAGTFPLRALEPDDLIHACRVDGIWMPRKGAYTRDVLIEMQETGGVPATTIATNPAGRCFLPLRSFKQHRCGLSARRVAALLRRHGACIGVLWVCPWYHRFNADRDDTLVYRGCGRSEDAREHSKRLYGDKVGSHAVVCIGYRFCGDQMHVLVLDNHSATGPRRWIDVEELDTLYTLTVDPFVRKLGINSNKSQADEDDGPVIEPKRKRKPNPRYAGPEWV